MVVRRLALNGELVSDAEIGHCPDAECAHNSSCSGVLRVLAAPSRIPIIRFDLCRSHADSVIGHGDLPIINADLDSRIKVLVWNSLPHADSVKRILRVLAQQGERRLIDVVGKKRKHPRELKLESDLSVG